MKHIDPALQYSMFNDSRVAKMVNSSRPGKKMGWDQQKAEQRQGDLHREMNTEARLKYEQCLINRKEGILISGDAITDS